jgi:2,3-bisphosphoglycerate-independent phosphoglycerate mutase
MIGPDKMIKISKDIMDDMSNSKRTLVIMLDGATDEKVPALDYKTPLQVSTMKFINSVASNGELGCTDAREYTHYFLLQFFTGKPLDIPRGVIEAFGLGLPLDAKRVAYRMTPAKIVNGRVEWYYKISCADEIELQKAVLKSKKHIASLKPSILFYQGGKAVMTVESDHILDLPKPPGPADVMPDDLCEFGAFAESVAELTGGITVLPWGGGYGKMAEEARAAGRYMPPMTVISKSPSALGVSAFLGINSKRVAGYKEGIKEAASMIKNGDVFLHVEETDDISHKRAPREKVQLLEEVDKELVRHSKSFSDCRIACIVDHGCSSVTGEHIVMKVPYAISDHALPFSNGQKFCEQESKCIQLGDLLYRIFPT